MVPTPVLLEPNVIRVFYTSCDANGLGRPGYIDVAADDPTRILAVTDAPLFDIGRPGTFDENGVLTTSVVRVSDQRWHLYYVGFEIGTQIRYRLLSGLAISDDGGKSWRRYQETPVLERSPQELYFRGGPCVLKENGRFRMWYVAGSEWIELEGKSMPVYDMKYLESADGIVWGAQGQTCLRLADPDEHGFGRPWVLPSANGYELHYSIRRKSLAAYRLGYATSRDGRVWTRQDTALNLDVSHAEPDDRAIMYSAVIRVAGREWCFYNGNDFGRAGILLAERIVL